MKIEFEINGQLIEGEFTFSGDAAQLGIFGETLEARVGEPEPGIFTIIINNRVYRCALDILSSGAVEVIVNGERIPVAARDKKHLRAQAGAGGKASGQVKLSSPMPGKIVRILLQPGDEVAAHQGILVVEAMKMQNELQSPRAGKIAEISVTEGQTVNAGETLAIID